MRRATDAKGAPGWARFTPWLVAAAVIAPARRRPAPHRFQRQRRCNDLGRGGVAMPSTPKDLRLEIIAQDFDPGFARSGGASSSSMPPAAEDNGSDTAEPAEGSAAASAAQVRGAGKGRSNAALRLPADRGPRAPRSACPIGQGVVPRHPRLPRLRARRSGRRPTGRHGDHLGGVGQGLLGPVAHLGCPVAAPNVGTAPCVVGNNSGIGGRSSLCRNEFERILFHE